MTSTIRTHHLVNLSHPLLFVPPLLAAERLLFSVEAITTRVWAEDVVAAVAHIFPALNRRTYPMNLCLLQLAATLHPPAPLPNSPLERIALLRDPCQAQASPQDYPVLWTQVLQWHAILKRVTPLKTLIQTRSCGGSGHFLPGQTSAPLKGPHPLMSLDKAAQAGLWPRQKSTPLLSCFVALHF